MSAYECYREYSALRKHFTDPAYDYFKYNGKLTVAKPEKFEANRDKLFYMKLAKHRDPVNLILANLVENSKAWIRDLAFSEEADRVYEEWLKRRESLFYRFTQEANRLNDDFNSNFIVKNNGHPLAMRLFFQKEISLETLVMLTDAVKCVPYWNKKLEYDPAAEEVITKIVKYRPFLEYDRSKVKKILVDKFGDVS